MRRYRGFGLMLAVFLIVTLATIGVYLVTVSTGQVQAVAQDEQATRAYQAARAGLEWGTYQRLRNASCAASTPLSFAAWSVNGFRAEVTCVLVGSETEGGTTVNVYRITSKGCNANPCSPATPAATYVEREMQITITQ